MHLVQKSIYGNKFTVGDEDKFQPGSRELLATDVRWSTFNFQPCYDNFKVVFHVKVFW